MSMEAVAYAERNLVAQLAAYFANELGYSVWWGVDPDEPDWPVLYIEGRTGQLSWHMPKAEAIMSCVAYPGIVLQWDGHTTEQKDDRIRMTHEERAGVAREAELPDPDACDHRFITTYGVTTADGGFSEPYLWACQECRLRFEPWKQAADKAVAEERRRLAEAVRALGDPPHIHDVEIAGHVDKAAVLALLAQGSDSQPVRTE